VLDGEFEGKRGERHGCEGKRVGSE
jgi:hypothetical protein